MASGDPRGKADALRYAQCWEDADVLLAALDVRPGDTCLAIGSAGDNALALLAADPGRVVVIDRSPAQIACLELRVAAYRCLAHGELLELVGSVPSTRRAALYGRCRPALSASARGFWDARPGAVAAGVGSAGRFERYLALFREHVLPAVHPQRVVRAMLQGGPREARDHLYAQAWNTWRWRLAFRVFFSRAVMGSLGRDRSTFAHVRGEVAERLLARTQRALTELDPADNPYLQWICSGRHLTALPYALRPERFDVIRGRLDRLEWHCCSLDDWLARARAGSLQRCNLSDVFEYQSPAEHASTLASLADAVTPGGRLVYWNLFAQRRRPPSLGARLRPLADLARDLLRRDRAFFYGDLVVEEVLA
ncbi:MAG: BtaA family protein [Betaproteobacteria bacterium]|nr:BtaA family protein [Betaproteobacteria bacterium]